MRSYERKQKWLEQGRQEAIKEIIALFKKDSIYSGAVIEFEIKNNLNSNQELNEGKVK